MAQQYEPKFGISMFFHILLYCSVCHSTYTEMNDLEKCTASFCPHCGASMLPKSCDNCVHLAKLFAGNTEEQCCNLEFVHDCKDNIEKSSPTIEDETDCPYYEPHKGVKLW